MKSKYFIYHIPGVKIGVTQNIKHRIVTTQKFTEYEILEEHTNAKEVSKREKILQAQYGYPVDKIEYWKTLRWQKKSQTSKAQKKRVANIDWKAKVANTDYSFTKTNKFPQSAYTPEAIAKKVANTDYKASRAKINWEQKVAKMDYSNFKMTQCNTPEAIAKRAKTRSRAVNQKDLEGNLLKRWESITSAATALGFDLTGISNCCRNKGKTAYKYIWEYA